MNVTDLPSGGGHLKIVTIKDGHKTNNEIRGRDSYWQATASVCGGPGIEGRGGVLEKVWCRTGAAG